MHKLQVLPGISGDFQKPKGKDEYTYIVATDFGTTRSAIAVCIVPPDQINTKKTNDIQIECAMASSEGSGNANANEKIDTIITYEHGLGDKFAIGPQTWQTIIMTNEDDTSYFAKDFKMLLHVQERRKTEGDVELKKTKVPLKGASTNTSEKPLLDVVRDYLTECTRIGYKNIVNSAKKRDIPVPEKNEIKWVVTVPAIWTDQARIAMRQCLCDTGMIEEKNGTADTFTKNIAICLEPEGAVLECFYQYLKIHPGENIKEKSLLVIDLGGGTADITTHFVESYAEAVNRIQLKELYSPLGGDWGGRRFNEEFDEKIIPHLLTSDSLKEYKSNEAIRYEYHLDHVNKLKNDLASQDITDNRVFRLVPGSDLEFASDAHEKLQSAFPKYKDKITKNRRAIMIPARLLAELFDSVLNPLTELLVEVNNKHKFDFAFLVGGLGSNDYIRSRLEKFLQEKYPYVTLFQPYDAGLAIVRGAVRFGIDSSAFGARVARTNYGISLYNKADTSKHIFSELVKKNDNLQALQKKTTKEPLGPYTPVTENQSTIRFAIYESNNNVKYVEDEGSMFVASIIVDVDMSVPFKERKFTITLSMDGPVISGKVTQVSNQKTYGLKWSSR